MQAGPSRCERDAGRTGCDEHREQDDDERDRRAEVGLGEDQEAEEPEQQANRTPQLPQRARRRPPAEIRRGPDGHRQLRELGGLKRHRAELDPAPGAVDARADHEHRQAARERRQHERGREQTQPPVVEPRGDDHQQDAEERVDALFLEVGHRVGPGERGRRRRRAVHHHEPERDEAERDEHEHVRLELALFHQRSVTSRRKASPRSS